MSRGASYLLAAALVLLVNAAGYVAYSRTSGPEEAGAAGDAGEPARDETRSIASETRSPSAAAAPSPESSARDGDPPEVEESAPFGPNLPDLAVREDVPAGAMSEEKERAEPVPEARPKSRHRPRDRRRPERRGAREGSEAKQERAPREVVTVPESEPDREPDPEAKPKAKAQAKRRAKPSPKPEKRKADLTELEENPYKRQD